MDITHEIAKRDYGQATRIVWGAVAILIVVSILALAGLWAMGAWPVTVDQNASARGLDADAARYSALGRSYGPGAAAQLYTDVSLFYAERMRAAARENAAMIANPELLLARRSYGSENALAANPELLLARRSYGSGNALAANPELLLARRAYGVSGALAPATASTSSAGDTPACSLEALAASEGILFWRSERGC